ncbi:protein PFC0760c [Eurytemora carolleeae]|uniref:protein PFC0760c n=1 Tax=Eurytemora carolleeae TaxID=1294199 RepID=UPI000C75DF4A|nr:protein PFC0760c [Eurytemora carolleeae]|eukprot:XP_023324853.1 protein PFC0760c-like [Eurytemora affinis]
MKDLALAVSGAGIQVLTGQHGDYPARNILESSESFWISCGVYPQILDISFPSLSSIMEIGIHAANVKKITILSSTEDKFQFKEITKSKLTSGEGRKQNETLYIDEKASLKAKHIRIRIDSGYHHFVGIYHIKVMGAGAGESTSATFTAGQMGIQESPSQNSRVTSGAVRAGKQSALQRKPSSINRNQSIGQPPPGPIQNSVRGFSDNGDSMPLPNNGFKLGNKETLIPKYGNDLPSDDDTGLNNDDDISAFGNTASNFGNNGTKPKFGNNVTIPQYGNDETISQFGNDDTISQFGNDDTISQFGDGITMSKFTNGNGISKFVKQDSISKFGNEDSISKFGNDDAISTFGDDDSVLKVGNCENEDGVSKFGNYDAVSNFGKNEAISKFGNDDAISNFENSDAISKFGNDDEVSNFGVVEKFDNDDNDGDDVDNDDVDDDNVSGFDYDTTDPFGKDDTFSLYGNKREKTEGAENSRFGMENKISKFEASDDDDDDDKN